MKLRTAKILGILFSVLVLFVSCGQLMSDDTTQVTIILPYAQASANSRAMTSEAIQRVRGDHAGYRVHINDTVIEGTGGNFSASFPVGSRVDVFIECVNGNGDVILRTITKTLVVANGQNSVSFNLKEDGTEIIPESQKGRVIYSYGEAEGKPGERTGLPSDPKTYKVGEEFEVMSGDDVEWTHGTFDGWKSNVELVPEDGGQPTSDPVEDEEYIMPEGGVVLTAQWNKNTYRIEYNDNADNSGGTQTTTPMPSTENITALENATVPSYDLDPVSANNKTYTFTGYWLTDPAGTDGKKYRAGDTIPMTGDITLYAQWSDKNVYTVTYERGSGPAVDNITNWKASDPYIEGDAAITLPTLSATGYTFNGWQVAGEAVTKAGGTQYTPTANVTLTAQWTRITYTIRYFKPNGSEDTDLRESVNSGASHNIKFDEMVLNLTATQKLDGFAISSGGSVVYSKDGTSSISSVEQNYDLYAIASTKIFKVRYESNAPAGTSASGTVAETTRQYGQSFNLAQNGFTILGYQFNGWYSATIGGSLVGNGGGTVSSSTYTQSTDEILTVYAQWTVKPYTITYNRNGHGLQPGNKTIRITDTGAITHESEGTEPGYRFGGWLCDDTGEMADSSWTAADYIQRADSYDQITLKAQWESDSGQ